MKVMIPIFMIFVLLLAVSAWGISYPQFGYHSQPIQCLVDNTVYTMTRYTCDYHMGRMLMNGEIIRKDLEKGRDKRSTN